MPKIRYQVESATGTTQLVRPQGPAVTFNEYGNHTVRYLAAALSGLLVLVCVLDARAEDRPYLTTQTPITCLLYTSPSPRDS